MIFASPDETSGHTSWASGIGAFLVWLLLDPTLKQWTLTMAVVAVATEIGLWVGAAILGVSVIQRLRNRWSLTAMLRGRRE